MIIKSSRMKHLDKYAIAGALPFFVNSLLPFALPFSLLFSAGLIIKAEYIRASDRYFIRDNEIIHEQGIFKKSRVTTEIYKITQISTEQSFIGRLLRYGDLKVETWGTPFELKNISKPRLFLSVLRS